MTIRRTLRRPAGRSDPIVVILAGASWPFLVTPVIVGAVAIVAAGALFHRFVTRAA